MSQVFISYASEDLEFVKSELSVLLKALGCEPWFSEIMINSSTKWEREIQTALQSSDWFILVMSQRSAKSEWVKNELSWAIDNIPDTIIPILLQQCNPTDFHLGLSRIQRIDFYKNPSEARVRLIERLVTAIYRPSFEYAPKHRARITGKWKSFWETQTPGEAKWIMENVEFQARGLQHLWKATENTSGYQWSGYGRFQSASLFVGTWKVEKPGSESTGLGTFIRNSEGNYLVGHWYGPNGDGNLVMGRWLLVRDRIDPTSVARKWYGASVAKTLCPSGDQG